VARAKVSKILFNYRKATPAPITPRYWEETPAAAPALPTKDLVDRVIDELEKSTAADRTHTLKVQLGWCSPDGRELPWRYWQGRAPNYTEYRMRGGDYSGVNVA
jgi:hypothetical protein